MQKVLCICFVTQGRKAKKKRKKKKNLSGDLFLKAQKCTFHPKFFTKNIGIAKNCEDN